MKLRAELSPVPVGAKISPWMWWLQPGLNMTEGERALYHGYPLTGKKVKPHHAGILFYVRIERPKRRAKINCLVASRSNRKPATECASGSGTGERAAVHRSRGAGPRLTRTISIPKRVGDAWADA